MKIWNDQCLYTADPTVQEVIEYNNDCIREEGLLQPERYVKQLGANISGNHYAEQQLQRESEWDGKNPLDALPEELRFVAADDQPFTVTQDMLDMLE